MLATQPRTTPAFEAFETQLRTLCLREFPCGNGTWRESKPPTLQKRKQTLKPVPKFPVSMQVVENPQHEKTETLEEYVGNKTSPWHLDYSWSEEAKHLREISVKSPWLIDNNFVFSHFKTLRIVGKNVSDVDTNLLRFTNLEELTLSCNYISDLNSKNLPPNLKVLEVCANEISDLAPLCVSPPRLMHLGLGFNRISVIEDYLTGSYWPTLLSLDLSHNNLSDLLDIVRKVSSLPKLRNLVLQGNPLSLIPGYRGYTVDSLKKLNILDDIMISADERHYFKGLARRREFILDESKVQLSVSYIKGVPMPDEIRCPEDQPEFPIIERKYLVQFMFLEDATPILKTTEFETNREITELTQLSRQQTLEIEQTGDSKMQSLSNLADQSTVEKNVVFTEEPDVLIPQTEEEKLRRAATNTAVKMVVEPEPSPDAAEKKKEEGNKDKPIKVAAVNSEGQVWSEDMQCEWSQMLIRDDLVALRDFFRQGMQISVVEETVEGHPFTDTSTPVPGVKVVNKDKREQKKDEKKEIDKAKGGGKDKEKDKKKKKELEQELKKTPPTYKTLATWHVPLDEFLEGEFEYKSTFSQEIAEPAPTIQSTDTDSARKRDSRPGSKRSGRSIRSGRSTHSSSPVKSSVSSRTSRRPSRSSRVRMRNADRTRHSKERKPDPKEKPKKPPSASIKGKKDEKTRDAKLSANNKKGDKGKGGKGGAPPLDEEQDENAPPPPLEIEISVHLHHWKTAVDSLKDQEEKNKNEEKPPDV